MPLAQGSAGPRPCVPGRPLKCYDDAFSAPLRNAIRNHVTIVVLIAAAFLGEVLELARRRRNAGDVSSPTVCRA